MICRKYKARVEHADGRRVGVPRDKVIVNDDTKDKLLLQGREQHRVEAKHKAKVVAVDKVVQRELCIASALQQADTKMQHAVANDGCDSDGMNPLPWRGIISVVQCARAQR